MLTKMWIFIILGKKWVKKTNRPKWGLSKWPGYFVVLHVGVPILWENVVRYILSTHPKPFDHILYGYENMFSNSLKKKVDFGLFFAYVQNRPKSTFFFFFLDFSKKYFHNRMRYDQTVWYGQKACVELHFHTIWVI